MVKVVSIIIYDQAGNLYLFVKNSCDLLLDTVSLCAMVWNTKQMSARHNLRFMSTHTKVLNPMHNLLFSKIANVQR